MVFATYILALSNGKIQVLWVGLTIWDNPTKIYATKNMSTFKGQRQTPILEVMAGRDYLGIFRLYNTTTKIH